MRVNKPILFFLLAIGPVIIFSQTKEELKKQKLAIEKQINYTTNLLNKTKNNKNKSLSYLNALEKQIQNKEQLLKTLTFEIKLISRQIKKIESKISNTKETILIEDKNIQSLKEEYSKMIYSEFIKKGNRNELIFIISAKDFNQAYKRITYLKQYASFRKNQAKKITETQLFLESKKEQLLFQKEQMIKESQSKSDLMSFKKEEILYINNSKLEKEELIKKLSKSEKTIKKRLKEQKTTSQELEDKIRKIIEEEIKKAREKAKKINSEKNYSLTPHAMQLSAEFRTNKGNLPWPLEQGVVVQFYGTQQHPIFSTIETVNNGIDIATDKNSTVRTVFDGTISRIFFIKGVGKAILISHGEYFTVYSGLKEISVKVGEKVLSKEKIGIVITQESELKTELHFEIWKGYEKQNPSEWLFKAY